MAPKSTAEQTTKIKLTKQLMHTLKVLLKCDIVLEWIKYILKSLI